jgi:serine protease AprX
MTTALPLQIRTRFTKLLALLAMLAMLSTAQGAAAVQSVARVVDSTLATYLATHSLVSVPVIVQTNGSPAAVEATVRTAGGHIDSELPGLPGFSATVTPGLANQLNHDSRVRRLNQNAPVKWLGNVDSSALLNRYETLSHVQSGWSAGLDGSEVKVAVIDTGVWPHNDLIQKSPYVPANVGNRLLTLTTNHNATDALDHFGHGTHVAGIVGGNGFDSQGQYIGVAPNSLLVSVKVSDDLGNANEGDVITGLDWVYQANRHGMGIRIVNLSVTSTVAQSYHQSALDAEVEKLWNSGVVVVVASGNNPTGGSVQYAPGNDPFAITVGSIEDNYQASLATAQMAPWALYGTTQDGVQKPDVVADGSHVVSLNAPGSLLSVQHPTNIQAPSAATYFKMGGTSMAAPQVAGMAAQMIQRFPNLTPGQVKAVVKGTSAPFGTTNYTNRLGAHGGFADVQILGWFAGADDNAGTAFSQSYDPTTNYIIAGGIWWSGANFGPNVDWTNVSWANVSWAAVDFANVSWANTSSGNPSQTAAYWSNVSWANVSWANVSWANVSWANVSWANVSWANVSWANVSWANVSWANVSWANVSWADTTFS